jgi:pimeloyl-ACP methyl ester carboxylesterase
MATASTASTIVESVDARINLTRFGTGQPNMLVAACGDVSLLSQVSTPFAHIDLRGQGKSTIERTAVDNLSLEHYMADFDAAIAHIKGRGMGGGRMVRGTRGARGARVARGARGKGVHLVGYSQGGFFTTHYAASHPEMVSSLILIEPALYTERDELLKRAQLAERGNGSEGVAAMLRYVEPPIVHGRSRAMSMATAVKEIVSDVQNAQVIANHYRVRAMNPITERHLRSLTMPVLLIGGTESHVKDMVIRAGREIPGSSVWWVEGASHLDFWKGGKLSRKVAPIIEAFMQEFTPSPE